MVFIALEWFEVECGICLITAESNRKVFELFKEEYHG